jgi:hypothetical protein
MAEQIPQNSRLVQIQRARLTAKVNESLRTLFLTLIAGIAGHHVLFENVRAIEYGSLRRTPSHTSIPTPNPIQLTHIPSEDTSITQVESPSMSKRVLARDLMKHFENTIGSMDLENNELHLEDIQNILILLKNLTHEIYYEPLNEKIDCLINSTEVLLSTNPDEYQSPTFLYGFFKGLEKLHESLIWAEFNDPSMPIDHIYPSSDPIECELPVVEG